MVTARREIKMVVAVNLSTAPEVFTLFDAFTFLIDEGVRVRRRDTCIAVCCARGVMCGCVRLRLYTVNHC